MNLSEYILLPREQRIAHIDLTTDCIFNHKSTCAKARTSLLTYLGVENVKGRTIHCCHLCKNNSGQTQICVNPLHTYFGTASENNFDKPFEERCKVPLIALQCAAAKTNELKDERGKSLAAVKAGRNSRLPHQKMVELIRISDKEVFIFESLKFAGEVLNLNPSNLGLVCKGRYTQIQGYTARYL